MNGMMLVYMERQKKKLVQTGLKPLIFQMPMVAGQVGFGINYKIYFNPPIISWL